MLDFKKYRPKHGKLVNTIALCIDDETQSLIEEAKEFLGSEKKFTDWHRDLLKENLLSALKQVRSDDLDETA